MRFPVAWGANFPASELGAHPYEVCPNLSTVDTAQPARERKLPDSTGDAHESPRTQLPTTSHGRRHASAAHRAVAAESCHSRQRAQRCAVRARQARRRSTIPATARCRANTRHRNRDQGVSIPGRSVRYWKTRNGRTSLISPARLDGRAWW